MFCYHIYYFVRYNVFDKEIKEEMMLYFKLQFLEQIISVFSFIRKLWYNEKDLWENCSKY